MATLKQEVIAANTDAAAEVAIGKVRAKAEDAIDNLTRDIASVTKNQAEALADKAADRRTRSVAVNKYFGILIGLTTIGVTLAQNSINVETLKWVIFALNALLVVLAASSELYLVFWGTKHLSGKEQAEFIAETQDALKPFADRAKNNLPKGADLA
jgi:hypothetical protein